MMTSCWPVYVEKHSVKLVPQKDSNTGYPDAGAFSAVLVIPTAVIHGQRPNRQEKLNALQMIQSV